MYNVQMYNVQKYNVQKDNVLNPITRGGFNQRSHAGGTKCPDSVKSITGQEILCKNQKIWYLFYALSGVFGHV